MNEIIAIWKAAWYELDQPIKCGIKDEFWLIHNGKNKIRFHTGLDDESNLKIINGEIISIEHKTLGAVDEINTIGLTYKVVLASGQFIQVEAEETPGIIDKDSSSFKEDFDDDDFQFEVKISML